MAVLSLSHYFLEVWGPCSSLLWLETGGGRSAHRARVTLGSLALSVALMEAISMSFAVPYAMASKIAVPSVRHQGL